jgi:hypothetical protein
MTSRAISGSPPGGSVASFKSTRAASSWGLFRYRPGGDLATTNLAFGGQDNKEIFVMSANSGTFWRFKTPNPGLIGPGGIRLPEQK